MTKKTNIRADEECVVIIDLLLKEVIELKNRNRFLLETISACLVAAGASEDPDKQEKEVRAAGNVPSDFIRHKIEQSNKQ